jgi:hypothetical protein
VLIKESGKTIWSGRSFQGKVTGLSEGYGDSDYVNFKAASGMYNFKVEHD